MQPERENQKTLDRINKELVKQNDTKTTDREDRGNNNK